MYEDFLELLEQAGLHRYVNIQHFLVTTFEKPDALEMRHRGKGIDEAMRFITSLRDRSHAHFDWNLFETPLYQGNESTQSYDWFDTYPLMATITVEGLEYLDSRRLIQSNFKAHEASIVSSTSQIRANKFTEKSFRTTTILGVLTVVLSAVAANMSYLTFEETRSNSRELKSIREQIHHLSLQFQRIEQRMSSQSGPKSSGKDSPRSGQPSSSGNGQTTLDKN